MDRIFHRCRLTRNSSSNCERKETLGQEWQGRTNYSEGQGEKQTDPLRGTSREFAQPHRAGFVVNGSRDHFPFVTTTAAAIDEHGVLRPLAPLPLAEGACVEVTVSDDASTSQVADGSRGRDLLREIARLPVKSGNDGF